MVVRFKPKYVFRDSMPLLSTESVEEFENRRSDFRGDLKPQNAVEKIYVEQIAAQDWEIMRLIRFKTGIFNLRLSKALYSVFVENLGEFEEGQDTVEYLDQWFTDAEVKQELLELLAKYSLDVSAIEAEAFRESADDWVIIDQLLAAAESARDRALRQFILCREIFSQKGQNKVIDATPAPRIASSKVVKN